MTNPSGPNGHQAGTQSDSFARQTVDADVHLSPDADGTSRIGMNEVLRRMDKSGVDRALVWLQPPYLRQVEPLNQYIQQAVSIHPYRAGNIAARYPELRILMVHMGGASFSDLSWAAIETAMKYENITLIGSAVRTHAILKAIRTLGADRVCFGSDTPFESMQVEVARYHAMLQEDVTPKEKDRIMGGNILSVLGLTE